MNAYDWLIKFALASVMPLSLFLGGWWGSIGRLPDGRVFIAALAGLALGIAVDLVWLRRWITKPFEVRGWALVAVFLFYSICTLGFFMGVPVLNLLPGAAAGAYAGRRLRHTGAGRGEQVDVANAIRRASMLTSAVMALVCAASAYIALLNPLDTASNLQGMLGIRSFQVTVGMVIAIIALGGPALVFAQYHVAKVAARMAYGREPR